MGYKSEILETQYGTVLFCFLAWHYSTLERSWFSKLMSFLTVLIRKNHWTYTWYIYVSFVCLFMKNWSDEPNQKSPVNIMYPDTFVVCYTKILSLDFIGCLLLLRIVTWMTILSDILFFVFLFFSLLPFMIIFLLPYVIRQFSKSHMNLS